MKDPAFRLLFVIKNGLIISECRRGQNVNTQTKPEMRQRKKNVFLQHKGAKSILPFARVPLFCSSAWCLAARETDVCVFISKEALKHQNAFCPTGSMKMRRRQPPNKTRISNFRIMQILNVCACFLYFPLCWHALVRPAWFYIIQEHEAQSTRVSLQRLLCREQIRKVLRQGKEEENNLYYSCISK